MARGAATHLSCATMVAAAMLLAGCAGTGNQARQLPTHVAQQSSRVVNNTRATPASRGQRIARIARDLVGTPYRYGGEDPSGGFDCSGLVFFAHRKVDLSVPRTSGDQFRAARPVQLRHAQPGDLVFFSDRSKPSHVGIYLGEKHFVHAPASGRQVSVASLDAPYYREHLIGLGRLH